MSIKIVSNSEVTGGISNCINKNMASLWSKYPEAKNLSYRIYIKTHSNKKHKHSVKIHTHLPRHDINLSANSCNLYEAIKFIRNKLSTKFAKHKKYMHH